MCFILDLFLWVIQRCRKKIHYKLLHWLLTYWNPVRQPKNSLVSLKKICFEFAVWFMEPLWCVTLALVSAAAQTPHYWMSASSLQTVIYLPTQYHFCGHSVSWTRSSNNENKHQILRPEPQTTLSCFFMFIHSIYFTLFNLFVIVVQSLRSLVKGSLLP